MRKSRVEKNQELYKDLESKEEVDETPSLDGFDIEDLGDLVDDQQKVQSKPIVDVVKEKKEEVKEEPQEDIKPNMTVVDDEEFKVEQPISYNKMLKAEEVLRAKLEKQEELKKSKKNLKRTPNTEVYTPEMMQKNINQSDGVDVRKDLNIKVRKPNNGSVISLVVLLLVVIILGVTLVVLIFNK